MVAYSPVWVALAWFVVVIQPRVDVEWFGPFAVHLLVMSRRSTMILFERPRQTSAKRIPPLVMWVFYSREYQHHDCCESSDQSSHDDTCSYCPRYYSFLQLNSVCFGIIKAAYLPQLQFLAGQLVIKIESIIIFISIYCILCV